LYFKRKLPSGHANRSSPFKTIQKNCLKGGRLYRFNKKKKTDLVKV